MKWRWVSGLLMGLACAQPARAWTPLAVSNDFLVRMPGTQPTQVVDLESDKQCLSCHGGFEMDHWRGSMMGQASRDPLFWAAMTVAAQDSVWALGNPNAADLCMRCHFPMGWLDGRSDPPNASLMRGEDYEGVSCKICHYMYNPHFKGIQDGTREGTDWTNYWDEVGATPPAGATNTYNADAAAAALIRRFDGVAFFTNNAPFSTNYDANGGGQYFITTDNLVDGGKDVKRASFVDANAKHGMLYSRYHKSRDMCAVCHDVSNPALHNLGASGTNALPSETDPAYSYFHIERTFSEFMASAYGLTGGATGTGPYSPDRFTTSRASNRIVNCQDCHFRDLPDGNRAGNSGVLRYSGSTAHPRSAVPEHWMTGGNAWVPWLLASSVSTSSNYDPTNAALLNQGPAALTLDLTQGEALAPALLIETSARAHQMLQDAISLTNASYAISNYVFRLRLQNHTPHKVISGFPEGRRMFLNVKAYASNSVIYEINPYDETADTLRGLPNSTNSPALDANQEYRDELVYEVHPRSAITGEDETYHMVLATGRYKDNRIPPHGFRVDEAVARLCEPVWHGAADTNYFTPDEYAGGYDDVEIALPPGTDRVEAGLYYQTTSREFVEFLRDEINGAGGTLSGTGAGGDPAYIAQTDAWFAMLAAWGDTIWQLWDHNRDVAGIAPVLMTNTYVQLDLTDADGDGIPAYWESVYFGGPTNADAAADGDGDGVDNYREYVAGTDPLAGVSVLAIEPLLVTTDLVDTLVLQWPSVTGRVYSIRMATNAVNDYTGHVTGIAATAPLNTYTGAAPAEAGTYYYGIGVSWPSAP